MINNIENNIYDFCYNMGNKKGALSAFREYLVIYINKALNKILPINTQEIRILITKNYLSNNLP